MWGHDKFIVKDIMCYLTFTFVTIFYYYKVKNWRKKKSNAIVVIWTTIIFAYKNIQEFCDDFRLLQSRFFLNCYCNSNSGVVNVKSLCKSATPRNQTLNLEVRTTIFLPLRPTLIWVISLVLMVVHKFFFSIYFSNILSTIINNDYILWKVNKIT